MALIFPLICRFTVVGSFAGQDCMNVLDCKVDDNGGGFLSRAERIHGLAGDILNNWTDHILPLLSTQYTALQVRWVDLDSAEGTTGSRSATDAETWPMTGNNPGPALPGNVYAKVIKQVQGKTRTQRNGVLRLGGLAEAATVSQDANRLEAGTIAEINAGFEDLKDGITGLAGGWDIETGVLHTVDGVATEWSPLSIFNCAPVVGTIRRRMPGYGS